MQGLLDSIKPLFSKYKIEAILITASTIIAFISIIIFILNSKTPKQDQILIREQKPTKIKLEKILVDISGAVEKPDVYQVTSGARLKDVLVLAGGLSADADRIFFARNFNLAKILADQEKIYVPSPEEVETGNLKQNLQTFTNQQSQTLGATSKISLNTASIDELDSLPGIGKVTAQKIIQNRPYGSIDELLNKKVVNKGLYEKIKDLIQL